MANPNVANEQLMELLLTLKKTTPAAARGILNSQPAIAYALMKLMVSINAINIEVFQKTLQEYGAANTAESSSSAPASAGTPSIDPSTTQLAPPPVAPAPIPAIPPHMQAQYRTTTPPTASSSSYTVPTHTPTPPYGYSANGQGKPSHPTPAGGYQAYGQQGYGQNYAYSQTSYQQGYQQPYSQPPASGSYSGYPTYGHPPPSQAPTPVAAPTSTPSLPDTLAGIPEEQKALIMRVISMTPEQINMLPPNERSTYIQIRTTLGIPTPGG